MSQKTTGGLEKAMALGQMVQGWDMWGGPRKATE